VTSLGACPDCLGLKVAVLSRDVIGQAKGLVACASESTSDEAFKMLVRASQRENVKLRDIAMRVVADHDRRTLGARSPGRLVPSWTLTGLTKPVEEVVIEGHGLLDDARPTE
jgi:hypothetical protein